MEFRINFKELKSYIKSVRGNIVRGFICFIFGVVRVLVWVLGDRDRERWFRVVDYLFCSFGEVS